MKTSYGETFVIKSNGNGGLSDLYSFTNEGRKLYNSRLVAADYGVSASDAFTALSFMSASQKTYLKTGATVTMLGLDPTEFNGGVDGGGDWYISESGLYDFI